ncbi:Glycosyltransferase involved in cell wall bisynthesis [Lentzea xinjiangensis]|uniref:Glycosyltransferase involved in cell wall bisynthesis n=1 Tax=Lentzea xinjiangensis TaxID=402600 RepID=A0A1H9JT86_9PSEU|nr:glycosyltransferase [Lentzea xinjiangensis]SEQ90231.1 Glycosyltransferase involved in cell wall bisynthesis [Lentzea xinjiangensis]
MKIAMLFAQEAPSWRNVQVADLATALAGLGHEVTVHGEEGPATPVPPGCRPARLRSTSENRTTDDGQQPYMGDFVDALRAEWDYSPPDLVHAHSWRSGLAAVLAAQPAGVPVVQSFQGLGRSTDQQAGVERLVGKQAALVLASCGQELLGLAAAGVPRSRIAMVPRGVDAGLFQPQGTTAARTELRRIVSVADPSVGNGVADLVAALPWLPGVELVIAGDLAPAATERLRQWARKREVEERVRLLGAVAREDMPALLRSADVAACVPSHASWEVWPLEAMACGVPVVATAVGGLTDAVIDGVTGVLVPQRDLKHLIRKLRLVLEDDTLRTSCSIAAVDRVNARHTWPDVARAVERQYRRLLDPPVPARRRARQVEPVVHDGVRG